MSVIAIQAEAGPYKVAEPQPELTETLADIRRLALEGLSELRRILGVLRTETDNPDTAPQPGLDRLGELITTAEAGGLTVECTVGGTERVVARATALSAYRIVQEALSNVMRHAPGAHVRIVTEYDLDRLRVTVANDPVDAAPDKALNGVGSGQGLVGMRERAGMLGGELTAEPTPEGGFVVTATLPLEPAS
jgi:signal transduction histidine kinase